eukprot:gnl/MRDRNA2_/MRDRNA2_42646_c0_seq1.p1 gnl/MRDRNA2_/MRDRNA2_42646_c0~~gnl/MRDRNA2_/MRDRNA2_42646_c0_seq1.p1  ORF type:complete len:128 (+),score=8.40 gnl/MRDRNA2_/MRDRNA2_42646_c0_seq1:37-384(+)
MRSPGVHITSAKQCNVKVSYWPPFDISKMVWSVSAWTWQDSPLLDSISSQALPRLSSVELDDLAAIAWAIAVRLLGHRPLRHALSASSLRRISPPNCVASWGLSNLTRSSGSCEF